MAVINWVSERLNRVGFNLFRSDAEKLGIKRDDWLTKPDLYLGLVLSSVLINLLSLAFPIALLQIYDRIVPSNAKDTLYILVLGVLTAVILEMLLRIARAWVSTWADAKFEHLACTTIFNKILKARYGLLSAKGAGSELDKIASLNTLKDFYGGQVLTTLLDVPFVFIFFFLIMYIGGWLCLVPLAFVTFMVWYTLKSGETLKESLEQQKAIDERRMNFIVQVLGGIHTVKAFGLEAQMLRRYEKLQENIANSDLSLNLHHGENSRVGSFISQFDIVLIVIVGCLLCIYGNLTLGGLAACTLLSGRMIQPVNRAALVWARLQTVTVTQKRLEDIMEMPSEEDGLPKMGRVKGDITLKRVSYAYDDEPNKKVLDNISLHIPFGQTIALHGRGFSGRTTLLNIIGGLLKPTVGRVIVDGKDIHEYDISDYRNNIGYLPEAGKLFDGTILDNITMFKGDDYNERAMDISELIGLSDVIEQMQEGYFTKLAQGTEDSIPRGVKQRITIARALINHPSIILFDEANSALDLKGDEVLRNVLIRLKGKCTLILISHRPSTLKLADAVYTIKDGQLHEGELMPHDS